MRANPWNFDARDASLLARLGFNVVRLGITWKGLEPGTAPANDPTICDVGPPGDPRQFNQVVLDRYLALVAQTVDLLGRFHIFTLLDMHQDVYNEAFDGEGAPNWAVCTDRVPPGEPPGRWSNNYATKAADAAYGHFWRNDVVGDLQGEFDRVWAAVASYFHSNPWVLGYDPFNEPFSESLVTHGDEQFDAQLECFYTGRAHVGLPAHGAPTLRCPRDDPSSGVIPQILAADPGHLVFYEPDIFGSRGRSNFVGPMDFPNLVFNVHIYCSYRSGKTGNPTNLAACGNQEASSLTRRYEDRMDLSSRSQPGGPAWFVSEFGATSSLLLLDKLAGALDVHQVGWCYWSWEFYGDPTGSAAEALLRPDGTLRPTARVLATPYPEAVAGIPTAFSFDPGSRMFSLRYTAKAQIRAPTVVVLPVQVQYPAGYSRAGDRRTDRLEAGIRPARGGQRPARRPGQRRGDGRLLPLGAGPSLTRRRRSPPGGTPTRRPRSGRRRASWRRSRVEGLVGDPVAAHVTQPGSQVLGVRVGGAAPERQRLGPGISRRIVR